MAALDERTMSIDSRMSPSRVEEKSRSRRSHFFSRSLSRGNFSWSFVRSALHPAHRNSGLSSSSSSLCSEEFAANARSSSSNSVSGSVSNVSYVSSDACSNSSRSSSKSGSPSSRSQSTTSRGTSGKRKGSKLSPGERKPVLVEQIPFGKSSKYLTVYVGPRIEQSVKYVISRKLLSHPLFQVLLKCSEDELGEDFSVEKGVAVVCDPALFLQVVRAVDDNLWNAQSAASESSDSNYASDA